MKVVKFRYELTLESGGPGVIVLEANDVTDPDDVSFVLEQLRTLVAYDQQRADRERRARAEPGGE